MDKVIDIANRHNLFVVEDAAQAVDSYYIGRNGLKRPLGSIGHLAAFSFHETKNVQCGEGGLLAINDERFLKRSEIIWEKGTNRAEFFRGEVNKYGWVDTGSSFLPSEVSAAFLWAQLEDIDKIQEKRKKLWQWYDENVGTLLKDYSFTKPQIPGYATNNAHMYYLVCTSSEERCRLIHDLKSKDILAVFHYLSLHKSPFYLSRHTGRALPEADRYSECLVRLPMYYDLDYMALSQLV
jgi:dTDP-4-amino-4,6-dideoxygalactose transaminase